MPQVPTSFLSKLLSLDIFGGSELNAQLRFAVTKFVFRAISISKIGVKKIKVGVFVRTLHSRSG